MINVTSRVITTVVGTSSGCSFVGDGGLATSARLCYPNGLAFAQQNTILYIADRGHHRIRSFNRTSGILTTIAGDGANAYSGDGGPAINASLASPKAVAVYNNIVYVADTLNYRIRMINLTNNNISRIIGNGNANYFGDNGLALNARIGSVSGIAFDENSNILYFADESNSRVRMINMTSGIVTTLVGNNPVGYIGGAFSIASIHKCVMLLLSGSILYFSELGNFAIRSINLQTMNVSVVAGPPNFDNGLAPNVYFFSPSSMVFDPLRNFLYIADQKANRIQRFNKVTQEITTIVGMGPIAGISAVGVAANTTRITNPTALCLDYRNNVLYFYDTYRIRGVNLTSGIVLAVAGTGINQYTGMPIKF